MALEPHVPGFNDFETFSNERAHILGEIPLRKFDARGDPILDPEGNPDTSFWALVPADTPISFQTLDRDSLALNMAQTWHQVRPGEIRTDCGGCHAHSQQPLGFEGTAAVEPDPWDLVNTTPLVKPVCLSCGRDPELEIRREGRLSDPPSTGVGAHPKER